MDNTLNGFENNGFIIIPPKSYEENSDKETVLHRKYITEFNKFYVNFKECNVIENILSKIHHASEYNDYATLDMNSIIKDLQNLSSNNNILDNIFTYLYFNLTILLREKNIDILEYIGKLKGEEIDYDEALKDHNSNKPSMEELMYTHPFESEVENEYDNCFNEGIKEGLKEDSTEYHDNEDTTPLFPDKEEE